MEVNNAIVDKHHWRNGKSPANEVTKNSINQFCIDYLSLLYCYTLSVLYHNLSTIMIYDSINHFGSRGLAPKIWSTEVGHLALQLVLVQPVSQSSKVTWWFFRVWPWKITVMFRGTSSSRSFPLANGASWFRVHSLRAMGKGPYGHTSSSNPQLMAASALILGKRIPPKGQLASRMF